MQKELQATALQYTFTHLVLHGAPLAPGAGALQPLRAHSHTCRVVKAHTTSSLRTLLAHTRPEIFVQKATHV